MEVVLQTCAETLEVLGAQGIRVHVAETNGASRVYNELAEQGEAVGGLFQLGTLSLRSVSPSNEPLLESTGLRCVVSRLQRLGCDVCATQCRSQRIPGGATRP